MVALALAESAVAVRPATGPVGTTALVSVSSEVTRPLDVPTDRDRCVCPAGTVQVVVADDLSAQ